MKDRISLLIKAKNLTAAQFADEIGVQKSSISHIISGRNNASLDFIQKILITYPEVNMEWLMFGKGPLFKTNENDGNSNNDEGLGSVQPDNSTDVDLFSVLMPAKSADFRKENDLRSVEETEENLEQEIVVNETKLPELKSPGETPAELIGRKAQNQEIRPLHTERSTKSIVKIVEFYSDNTYKEYFPG